MGINDFEKRFAGSFDKTDFENEHGERFVVYTIGISVWLVGDETDWEVIPLFNSKFNIWNATELRRLGEALVRLHPEGKNRFGQASQKEEAA